jgi:hypothetical protein
VSFERQARIGGCGAAVREEATKMAKRLFASGFGGLARIVALQHKSSD